MMQPALQWRRCIGDDFHRDKRERERVCVCAWWGCSACSVARTAACCACMQGLWRGTVPGLLLTVPYTAVQFVALQQVKEAAAKMGLTGRWQAWHGAPGVQA